jgi:hypothetical protein
MTPRRAQETPSGRKKIIPTGLDNSVSSPDESPPSPPSPGPTFALSNRSNNNSSSKSNSLTRDQSSSSLFGSDRKAKFSIHDDSVNEDDLEKKRRSIGLKLKTSYSKCLSESASSRTVVSAKPPANLHCNSLL